MGFTFKRATTGLVFTGFLGLAACSPIERFHGYTPSEAELQDVLVGIDTRDTVISSLGTPSTSDVTNTGDFFYVASQWKHIGPFAPKEVSREVVAVRFGADDVVTNVERFGLEDGNVVVLSRRITEGSIQNLTFLRQLLGTLGNFDAGQFIK
jgi:outer membrane protein assembly factor BamE (lipoprotein component of BamABCDE complex)